MRSVELFAGAGGLALGVMRAGFRHEAVIEWDEHACSTIRENQRLRKLGMERWPLHETDVREFEYGGISPDIDLLAAGAPCQPFSIGGKHRGHADERNMFPYVAQA